jgi:hypothetical protein
MKDLTATHVYHPPFHFKGRVFGTYVRIVDTYSRFSRVHVVRSSGVFPADTLMWVPTGRLRKLSDTQMESF